MRRSFILFTVLVTGIVFGQDEKAKGILDKISAKTKAYESINIDFKIAITPPEKGTTTIKEGKALMKGDKYLVNLDDQDIYCDGTTITTHLKEEAECYTSSVEDTEGDGVVSPSKMLSIWEEGYKYKYVKETVVDGRAMHQIHLYPKDPGKSKFHTIILKIDKEKNEVQTVFIKSKDGSTMKYTLNGFKVNENIGDKKFEFDRSKHPEVECYEE